MTENEQGNQMSIFDLGLWCSRTSSDSSVLDKTTLEKTSESSSKRPQELPTVTPVFLDLRKNRAGAMLGAFWEMDGLSLGAYMMPSFGESPSVAVESRLSQILEEHPHPKYSLSARACQGVLNRAEKRGKELPSLLRQALVEQVTRSRLGGGAEHDRDGRTAGKGALIQKELSGTLGAYQDQTLFEKIPTYGQDGYDKYHATDKAPTLKDSGGNFGGVRTVSNTVNALCSRDYKGVGTQYINDNKVVITYERRREEE